MWRFLVNGTATRSFQFVDDCIDGIHSLMESEWRGGPINLGSEAEMSITSLAQLIVREVALKTGRPPVGIRFGDGMPDDPVRRRPDCSLAKSILCWATKVGIAEGLDRTIAWHLRNSLLVQSPPCPSL